VLAPSATVAVTAVNTNLYGSHRASATVIDCSGVRISYVTAVNGLDNALSTAICSIVCESQVSLTSLEEIFYRFVGSMAIK
jgi:hypothetical protein